MIDVKTQYAGLTLSSPLIVGSSGLTRNPEKSKEFEKAGAGAIVLKSLFEEQIELQSDSLSVGSDYPEAVDYIRGYVKANQLNDYLELIRKTKAVCTIPVISSINCYRSGAWVEFAHEIEKAGADAIELNIFFLETDLTYNSDTTRDLYVNIVRNVKKAVSIPVTVKMSKSQGNIPALINDVNVNGANGFVLFNRYYQPDIDINKMQIVSGNVFSSTTDLSDTLRWIAITSSKIPGISIAASTGVHDWDGVIKCLLAGASAVELCSAVYLHGPSIISQMLTCLEEWMHQSRFDSLKQFIGKLNMSNIQDPAMYERLQFMKYFSNRD